MDGILHSTLYNDFESINQIFTDRCYRPNLMTFINLKTMETIIWPQFFNEMSDLAEIWNLEVC